MADKPRIAILGDFPVGLVNPKYSTWKSTCAPWLHILYSLLINNNKYEFHWITVDKDLDEEDHFHQGKHFFHVLPGAKLSIGLITAYWFDRKQIRKCLKAINPNLVHAWGTERCYGLAAKDFNGKKMLSAQGILIAYKQRARISRFEVIQSLYEKSVYRKMDLITVESPWGKDRLMEIAPNTETVLFEYAVHPAFGDIKRKLTEHPSCFMAGTYTPVKNIKLAIDAFSSPELSHITLYIAGSDQMKQEQFPQNIIPVGRINRDGIKEYLSKVWALVHPSLADTCPNIVKEARWTGVPAIVTIDCGAKQYVENQNSGFVIKPNNKSELIQAVLKLTESRDLNISMGNYQKEECQHALCTETMVSRILQIYNNILNQ